MRLAEGTQWTLKGKGMKEGKRESSRERRYNLERRKKTNSGKKAETEKLCLRRDSKEEEEVD